MKKNMKKILLLLSLFLILGGCSQYNDNLVQDKSDLKQINDYVVLQQKEYKGKTIYFLAKNFKEREVALWFGAPQGIEQHGEFYLYQGDPDNIKENNVVKLNDLIFSHTKNYFELRSLGNDNFVVIEQYEGNNDSRFYFWHISNDSFMPVKFNQDDFVISGWRYDSIKFLNNNITVYGYHGDQPFDYSETYTDYLWDSEGFELIMQKKVYPGRNKYSFFLDIDKSNPTWGKDLNKEISLLEYYFTPNRAYVVYIKSETGNGWQIMLVDIETSKEIRIISDELFDKYGTIEYPVAYQFVKDKSSDEFIFYRIQPVEIPGYIEYKYNIETGETIYVEEKIKDIK